ncbi:hypothetical protein TKK_0018691 [Trichogramma kaykai]|uniref:Tc1-like transposase DDE domain-containing protein n=1 Tax=Trichogramma kaykai TaxID=54128 RepID=A0ABD2VY51_9HYME
MGRYMVGNRLLGPVLCEAAFDGESYLEFLNVDFSELLDENFTRGQQRELVLMHDGAPAHWAAPVLDYLDEHWTQRWIGRYGPVAWPPRSPDLNPLDYFHWGVYHYGAPDSLEELRNRIEEYADAIPPESIQRSTRTSN